MSTVEEELKSVGLKVTPQRALILRYIKENSGKHFSAEQIHKHVMETTPNVPPATVYNILRTFVEKGKVNTFEINGKAIYESRMELHVNFICETCGEITDHDVGNLGEELYRNISGKIISSSIVVRGICNSCLFKVKDA